MSLILKETDYLVGHRLDSLNEFNFKGYLDGLKLDSLDEFDFKGYWMD